MMFNNTSTNRKQFNRGFITLILLIACFTILLTYYHQTLLNLISETSRTCYDGNNILPEEMDRLNQLIVSKKIGLKTILLWNSPHRVEVAAFGTGHKPFVDHGCPVTNCYIQANSSKFWRHATINHSEILKSFDAVLVNVHELWLSFLPNYERPANQRLVWLTQESPMTNDIVGEDATRFDRIFNWTMTYRMDSDIQLLYGRMQSIYSNGTQNDTKLREERRAILANKTGTPVSWMVSHCETGSRREDYVRELREHIQVDVYGGCGNLSCPRSDQWISNPECYELLGQKYKFYLSFENTLCKDYVTEKFFSILQLNMVPVVFGAADYQSIAPKYSYIDALNFSSPAKLAEYLHLLDEDDELYLDYLEWKSHYRIEAGVDQMARYAFCDLCAKLNRNDEPEKVYDSIVSYWSVSTQCRPGWNSSNLSTISP